MLMLLSRIISETSALSALMLSQPSDRSIGDADLKNCGVTAEPEVEHFKLQSDDAFLVMATDGLWDTLTNEAVVSLIQDTVK